LPRGARHRRAGLCLFHNPDGAARQGDRGPDRAANRFGLIDDPGVFDIMLFKRKSVSIYHELMFTRPIYGTPVPAEQGLLLKDV
jgi:hypothetical protein